jgi:hypothetical protein
MKNMKMLLDHGKYLATRGTRAEGSRSGQLVHSVHLVAMQLMPSGHSSQR